MKQNQTIRLFKNDTLEALSHVHPSIPFIFWIPAISYMFYQAFTKSSLNVGQNLFYIGGGIFFWTFIEYFLHRYLFHWDAQSKWGKALVFMFHGCHHDAPQDATRLVLPLPVSIPLSIPFYLLFKVSLGSEAGLSFFAGFITGYLVYDYIHFATHHFMPRTKWGKTIKENHMKHHFIAKKGKWGVSTPLWDHVFGTFKQD